MTLLSGIFVPNIVPFDAQGGIAEDELRRMLGFGTRYQLDGFLKAHDVWIEYTLDDFRREVDSLKQLGL